jgi:hypothetical protein
MGGDTRIPRAVRRFVRLTSLAKQGCPRCIVNALFCFTHIRHGFGLFDTHDTKVQCSDKSAIQYTRKVSFGWLYAPSCVRRRGEMRDLMADWNKWSSAERLLAAVLMLMLIGLPLRVWVVGTPL